MTPRQKLTSDKDAAGRLAARSTAEKGELEVLSFKTSEKEALKKADWTWRVEKNKNLFPLASWELRRGLLHKSVSSEVRSHGTLHLFILPFTAFSFNFLDNYSVLLQFGVFAFPFNSVDSKILSVICSWLDFQVKRETSQWWQVLSLLAEYRKTVSRLQEMHKLNQVLKLYRCHFTLHFTQGRAKFLRFQCNACHYQN